MSLLEVQGLNIYLRAGVEVVKDLSISIPKRSIFGLVGESGCGKSLTALSIMGILPRTMQAEGSIVFNGQSLLDMPEPELRQLRGNKMSMVFQEPMTSLNPVLRVGYQITEVLTTHLKVTNKEAQKLATSLLRSVRIPSPEVRMREYPHQMSGGMRQRVMVAMALACSPDLLIADEPTTALDVTIEAQLLELIRTLRDDKGTGVLLITHDLGIIAQNAENMAIMYAGRIVEQAPVAAIFDAPMHPYTAGLLGSLPKGRSEPLEPIAGVVPKPGHLPQGCTFNNRCKYAIAECAQSEPALAATDEDGLHLARCIRAQERPWR